MFILFHSILFRSFMFSSLFLNCLADNISLSNLSPSDAVNISNSAIRKLRKVLVEKVFADKLTTADLNESVEFIGDEASEDQLSHVPDQIDEAGPSRAMQSMPITKMPRLPLNTIEDIENFESFLQNPENLKNAVSAFLFVRNSFEKLICFSPHLYSDVHCEYVKIYLTIH